MQIDKQNGNVAFCDSSHKYWDVTDPNKKYVSVTTLIHSYAQDFDASFWSAYKALEQLIPKESWAIEKKSLLNTHRIDLKILDIYNINESDFNKAQQDILDEWERKKNKSCERGTNIHAQLENSFYGDKTRQNTLKKLGIGGKFECKKNYNELILDKAIYPEYLISRDSNDGYLHLAGQIDVLVKDGNSITIIDWKTNEKIDLKGGFNTQSKSSAKMKYPLNTLDDCNYNHYQLQLSTYAWMLQKINPNFEIKDLILYHFDHKGNETLYHCKYLKKEVERMLIDYKKKLIHEDQINKRKRIDY